MSTSIDLFNNAELSLAAYATLENGPTDGATNKQALIDAGMTEEQAFQFAARYPTVVAVIPNTESGFSTTVFQAANGSLTVAIRGTEFPDDPVDLLQADLQEIALGVKGVRAL